MSARVFAGPATLSNASLIIAAPIGIGAAVISDAFATWQTRVVWLVVGIIAQLGLTAVVLIGRWLGAGRRRGSVLVIVALAAAVRAVIIIGLLPLLGAQDPLATADRMIGATVTITMWLLLIGATWEAIARTRAQLEALLMRVDIALAEADALQQAFARDVSRAQASSLEDLERTARALHRTIDRQLRPLSHRLWFGVASPQVWRRMTARIASQPVPIVPVTALLTWSLAWNSFLRFGPLLALEVTVVTMGSLAAVLMIGRVMTNRFALRPQIANPVTIVAAVLLSSIALWGFPFTSDVSASDDVSGWLGVTATNLIILVLSVVIASAYRLRAEQVQQLTDAVEDLEPRRRAAASFLHNNVNSSWRALAMQLEIAARTDDLESARRLLAQVTVESTRAGFIEHESAAWARLSQAPQRWAGLAHVTLDVHGEVPEHLRSPISQLVDEAITNAVRHGRARHVEAIIEVASDTVEVVVVDDGTFDDSSTGSTGLGSAWLDAQAQWYREHDARGTRLTVRWPCLP